jgi:hypothetical protein
MAKNMAKYVENGLKLKNATFEKTKNILKSI